MPKGNGGPAPREAREQHPLFEALDVATPEEALVKIGYGDLFGLPVQLYNFRIDRLPPDRAAELLRLIGEYSDTFNGDEVADTILTMAAEGLVHYVNLGREGSPAVYVAHMLNTEDLGDPRLLRIVDFFKALGADEIEPDGPYIIRAWWD